MVLSASFARAYYTSGDPLHYFTRQMIFAVGGVALMIFVSYWKVSTFRKLALPVMAVSLLLLAAVPVIGTKVNGSRLTTGLHHLSALRARKDGRGHAVCRYDLRL